MSELDRFLEGDGEEGFDGLTELMKGYQPTEADLLKVVSWQYCPYCLAEEGREMPENPSGIEGNRWTYYQGDNRYKCQWCGGIFEGKEGRRSWLVQRKDEKKGD